MVVQRTLAKIEQLKERPHHERHRIAVAGSVTVMAVLFVFWGYVSLDNMSLDKLAERTGGPSITNTEQAASAAAALEQKANILPVQLVASSTNGRVDLVPAGKTGL